MVCLLVCSCWRLLGGGNPTAHRALSFWIASRTDSQKIHHQSCARSRGNGGRALLSLKTTRIWFETDTQQELNRIRPIVHRAPGICEVRFNFFDPKEGGEFYRVICLGTWKSLTCNIRFHQRTVPHVFRRREVMVLEHTTFGTIGVRLSSPGTRFRFRWRTQRNSQFVDFCDASTGLPHPFHKGEIAIQQLQDNLLLKLPQFSTQGPISSAYREP